MARGSIYKRIKTILDLRFIMGSELKKPFGDHFHKVPPSSLIDSSFISQFELSKTSRNTGCGSRSHNEKRYFSVIHQESTPGSCYVKDKEK